MKKLLTKLLALLALAMSAPLFAASVSMTSPSNGALYLAPATLPMKANASAPGATVTQVEFFANGVSIGVDTTSPYQFDWTAPAAGTYSITAVVTDSNGATATSAARTITVAGTNTAPTVSLSTPADNSRYLNPATIPVSANASGPELNDIVQSVAFYLNGSLAQTVTSAPFSYSASGLAARIYSLTAVVTDSQGLTKGQRLNLSGGGLGGTDGGIGESRSVQPGPHLSTYIPKSVLAASTNSAPPPPGELGLVFSPLVLPAFPAATRLRAGVQHAMTWDGEGEPAARAGLSDGADGFRRADPGGDL